MFLSTTPPAPFIRAGTVSCDDQEEEELVCVRHLHRPILCFFFVWIFIFCTFLFFCTFLCEIE